MLSLLDPILLGGRLDHVACLDAVSPRPVPWVGAEDPDAGRLAFLSTFSSAVEVSQAELDHHDVRSLGMVRQAFSEGSNEGSYRALEVVCLMISPEYFYPSLAEGSRPELGRTDHKDDNRYC